MIMLTEKQTPAIIDLPKIRIIVVIYLTLRKIHLSFGFGEFTGSHDVPGGESRGRACLQID